MSLLRVLIPSWKFFDELGSSVELRYRTTRTLDSWDLWQESPRIRPVSKQPLNTRPWWRLFLNAPENLKLAEMSLLERLAFDLSSMPDPDLSGLKSTLSYQLVESWIRFQLSSASAGAVRYFQFELIIRGPSPNRSEDHYLSEVHSV